MSTTRKLTLSKRQLTNSAIVSRAALRISQNSRLYSMAFAL
jgi:hypothetical protein